MKDADQCGRVEGVLKVPPASTHHPPAPTHHPLSITHVPRITAQILVLILQWEENRRTRLTFWVKMLKIVPQNKTTIIFLMLTVICCSKGDHDGAMKQYIRTIGHLEPSYVIRKVQFWWLYRNNWRHDFRSFLSQYMLFSGFIHKSTASFPRKYTLLLLQINNMYWGMKLARLVVDLQCVKVYSAQLQLSFILLFF